MDNKAPYSPPGNWPPLRTLPKTYPSGKAMPHPPYIPDRYAPLRVPPDVIPKTTQVKIGNPLNAAPLQHTNGQSMTTKQMLRPGLGLGLGM